MVILFWLVFIVQVYGVCKTNPPGVCNRIGLFRGFCYCSIDSDESYPTNRDTCNNNWGNLTSLHSEDEMNWILDPTGLNCGGFGEIWTCLRHPSETYDCKWKNATWSDESFVDFQPPLSCAYLGKKDFMWKIVDGVIRSEPSGDGSKKSRAVCKYKLFCHSVWAGSPVCCSGHGNCIYDDICECHTGYYGKTCNVSSCYGILSNRTSSVCSGHGNCSYLDKCTCNPGYFGGNCSQRMDEGCDDPKNRYNGYCYKNAGSGRSFDEAEEFCKQWNIHVESHLISIHSSNEENWVISNLLKNDSIWTGLKKYDVGGLHPCPPSLGYDWADQSSTDYIISKGKNISCVSHELCIGITNSSLWSDVECSNRTLSTTCKFKIPLCYGIPSFEISTVCSGKGKCIKDDNCSCIEQYYGSKCDRWKCFGIFNDDVDVCSKNGNCKNSDFCVCNTGYAGENCNSSICSGILSTDRKVCNSEGNCVHGGTCICNDNYAGDNCEFTRICSEPGEKEFNNSCYIYYKRGISMSGASDVCENWGPGGNLGSMHSKEEYSFADEMRVGDAWFGLYKLYPSFKFCNYTILGWDDGSNAVWYGRNYLPTPCATVTKICFKERGMTNLAQEEDCFRDKEYLCKKPIPICFGLNATNFEVCSGKGLCYDNQICYCFNKLDYKGLNCNITKCNNILSNTTQVCSNHGKCWPKDHCECNLNYFGKYCEIPKCFGIIGNSSSICNSHGVCSEKDVCKCFEGYYGKFCNITTCDNIFSNITNNSNICSNHGICNKKDDCDCSSSNYFGRKCENTYCNGIPSNSINPRVCSGTGDCAVFGKCDCEIGYFGEFCNITTCSGILSNNSDVCSQHGVCFPNDYCECSTEKFKGGPSPFIGKFCEPTSPCTGSEDISLNEYCYRYFGLKGTFNKSEEFCQSWFAGGHLISIQSFEEDEFVRINITQKKRIWLGLEKKTKNETKFPCPVPFEWTDLSSLTYASTVKSINCTKNFSCIIMNSGGSWEDANCDDPEHFLTGCKFKIPKCNGILANNLSHACHGRGWCISENNCLCKIGYFGNDCELFVCDFLFNDSRVCSGHGICEKPNYCVCKAGYYPEKGIGNYCQNYKCFGILYSDPLVCSGRNGTCSSLNNCTCNEGYYGSKCEIWNCNGTIYNDTKNVCTGHGSCSRPETCICEVDYYPSGPGLGKVCQMWMCHGQEWNNPEVCGTHGTCVGPNDCVCSNTSRYFSQNCTVWKCYDAFNNETNVCSGHGICEDYNQCKCLSKKYTGDYCQFWTCFGSSMADVGKVCAGHGSCVVSDLCICSPGYFSTWKHIKYGPCDGWSCGDHLWNENDTVCSGRGKCVQSEICICNDDYDGETCESWSCGYPYNDPNTCSGNGKCISPKNCRCVFGYEGDLCDSNILYGIIMAPVLSIASIIFLVFVACMFCCVFCSMCFLFAIFVCCIACGFCLVCCCSCVTLLCQLQKLKKFGKLKNFDLLLKEQELEEDSSIAHIRIDHGLFEIPFEEVKIERTIGMGGSNSVVFKATWRCAGYL